MDGPVVTGTPVPGLRSLRGLPRRYTPAAALACATVLVQIGYPLLSGGALRTATIVAVCCFVAASLTHAAAGFGAWTAVRVLAVAGGLGWAAEAIGVRTGFPFGHYSYAGTLGPQLLGVPVVVPLAWTMTAYPCLLLGRRLAARRPAARRPAGSRAAGGWRRGGAVAAIGGSCLAGWDLYLDPQMVAEGHWRWADPVPALPGAPGIPVTNYLGWLLVGVLIVAALHAVVPGRELSPQAESVPAGLLGWTWLGSALANLAFFDRPAVALYGGVAMGLTVLPYLRALLRADRAVR